MVSTPKVLRERVLAALVPANALFIAVSCGGTAEPGPGGGSGAAPAGGTTGTGGAGAGSGGAMAGSSGATVGAPAGGRSDAGTGGTGGGSPGTEEGGVAGSSGTTGTGGAAMTPTHTWGDVTVEGRNCLDSGVGTCCYYDFCFSPEKASELLSDASTPPGDAAGGAPDAGMACPSGGQLAFCTKATLRESKDGQCCYEVLDGTCCGRPLVVAGQQRQARLSARADWRGQERWVAKAELTDEQRRALAAAWADDALMEHASVGSFARFALELLGAGAPADLVEDAQRASLDEIAHARLCFQLASGFAGKDLGPSALPVGGAELDRSLADLAVAVLLEGAVGETLAAALANEQLRWARDAECRAALEVIARDEAAHALLAWRFLRYAVNRGGSTVVERLREAAATAPRDLARKATEVPLPIWNHYGRLSSAQQGQVVAAAWSHVIAPAIQLLCGEPVSLPSVVRRAHLGVSPPLSAPLGASG